jgi:hypothetical protein
MPTLELSLKSSTYTALKQQAQQRNQSIEEIIEAAVTTFLSASIPAAAASESPAATSAKRRAKIHTEAEAWRAMPEVERSQYRGQFVAVHQGQVIDHDPDRLQLYRRVREQLGNIPVLITPARESHPREFQILSPRLEPRQ